MKTSAILIICVFFLNQAKGQPGIWKESKNWRVYKVPSYRIEAYPVDSLKYAESKPLDQDSMQHFLSEVEIFPLVKDPYWMGAYLTSCESQGRLKKIIISTYGGFFFDAESKKYYVLPLSVRQGWLNYLADSKASF